MTYFLLACIAVFAYGTFYYRAQVSELSNLFANKCWDYDASMAVNGELQAELDSVCEQLELEVNDRMEREFREGSCCINEADAIAAGYVYSEDGELVIDNVDKLHWTAQDSTNDHIFYS